MSLEPETTDYGRILAALRAREVSFVLIGGLAAILQGSPFATEDVDITPEASRENLQRLSEALRDLGARVRTQGVEGGLPFDHDADSLAAASVWNLTTEFGDLDISFVPTGTAGYPDLTQDAVDLVAFGVAVRVSALADVVRSKQAANRPKDQRVLPTLREILANRDLDAK
jgi:hypothetical protein